MFECASHGAFEPSEWQPKEVSMPAWETWRVVYKDTTRVLYLPSDEIVTFLPNGVKHREYQLGEKPRFETWRAEHQA